MTGLLAQVLVAKYLDHLPLYRQEAIFERAGRAIARSTLAQWVGEEALKLFRQLYEVERAAAKVVSQARLEARRAARPLADALNQGAATASASAGWLSYRKSHRLQRQALDGAYSLPLPIDNNWVKKRIRPIAHRRQP